MRMERTGKGSRHKEKRLIEQMIELKDQQPTKANIDNGRQNRRKLNKKNKKGRKEKRKCGESLRRIYGAAGICREFGCDYGNF